MLCLSLSLPRGYNWNFWFTLHFLSSSHGYSDLPSSAPCLASCLRLYIKNINTGRRVLCMWLLLRWNKAGDLLLCNCETLQVGLYTINFLQYQFYLLLILMNILIFWGNFKPPDVFIMAFLLCQASLCLVFAFQPALPVSVFSNVTSSNIWGFQACFLSFFCCLQ